ncbi:MAG: hypothetical protein KDB03_05915 [Planctomycetales bacterium]|nr:hypothetical protein [Planctomycetales bacterium]
MLFTHEMGHILGGWFGGGELQECDLWPWHLPYSIFEPDPQPLLTLWSGPIVGVLFPLTLAIVFRRSWVWFLASFCSLANGLYLATGWWVGDRYLDTTGLLEHGASRISLAVYCSLTIGWGYVCFRRTCLTIFGEPFQ